MADTLNKALTYLFLIAKAKARLKNSHFDGNKEQVSKAKAIYEIQIKRYIFGIGFFASFIEGTDAYQARQELYNALMDVSWVGDDSIFSINNFGALEFFWPILHGLDKSMKYNDSNNAILKETIFADGKADHFSHRSAI